MHLPRWLPRARLARLRGQLPAGSDLRTDLIAGLPGAASNVPGGMATALLAGAHPIQGLYASFAGPIAGGLATRSRLMVITTTSAAALATASAIRNLRPDQRPGGVALITLLVAAALGVGAALQVGRYTRFVSYSVMTGFLSGVAINIICSQIPVLTQVHARGPDALVRALYVLTHPLKINVASLVTGLAALAILIAMARPRLAMWGPIVALAVPTTVADLAGVTGVARVSSLGRIAPGIPLPGLPDFRLLSYGMISGALAIAAIVVVQAAGVAQALLDDTTSGSDNNRDIGAQGFANLASSLFSGIPVGGSLSQTVLNVATGARTRLAAIASGGWMVAILLAFSGLVGRIALPTLAATLIYLGASSLQVAEMVTIARTGPSSQVALITTFVATLTLPVAAAVGVGVALSMLLQVNRETMDLRVVELVPLEDGRLAEASPPRCLPGGHVTILDVYGSVLYAGARTLERKLPEPDVPDDPELADSYVPVLVLRLRGRTSVGATFVKVVADYADRLAAAGGRLYLSDVDPHLADQLRRTGRLSDPVRMVEAEPVISQATYSAYLQAQEWLTASQDGDRVDRRPGRHGQAQRRDHAQE